MILAGDIGGTYARFACIVGGGVTGFARLAGDDHPTFEAALAHYLSTQPVRPARAAFAVAGPIAATAATLTNRSWRIDAAALKARFGFIEVLLVNDFEALARGVATLPAESFSDLKPGRPLAGAPMLVCGPGTGFGVAALLREPGGGVRVLAGEGGHMAYAPRNPFETRTAAHLQDAFGYVSVEMVTAGVGYAATYKAARAAFGLAPEEAPAPDEILAAAAEGEPFALAFCRLRAGAVMGAAGDGALLVGAHGGVVIAGGVAQRLAGFLAAPEALARFSQRGTMTAYLADVPIRLLRDGMAPLLGAAAFLQPQTGGRA